MALRIFFTSISPDSDSAIDIGVALNMKFSRLSHASAMAFEPKVSIASARTSARRCKDVELVSMANLTIKSQTQHGVY